MQTGERRAEVGKAPNVAQALKGLLRGLGKPDACGGKRQIAPTQKKKMREQKTRDMGHDQRLLRRCLQI
jgi:hypothetical protein